MGNADIQVVVDDVANPLSRVHIAEIDDGNLI